MIRQPMTMNECNMLGATERAKMKVRDILKLAKNIEEDLEKKERLEKHECKPCFYGSRIGGAAMTSQACMCCHEMQMYGSTNTDVLCKPCAVKTELCKHCGGDIEMRVRRKEWPEPI